ncbi:ATP-binding protein [Alkalimarinus sediminis]|uniref:histidine kinase n=1 Tax=Alkalimarinus sediminis TaxID=1632866 RepID=A0A9E8HN60_9ALTE|nr:ATP-binding protein [Alkalimarinus sediminis]UZW75663.1 ATP-binding protein [Alkalimarinus sediminis]
MTLSKILGDKSVNQASCIDFIMHLKQTIPSVSIAWLWHGQSFLSSMENSLMINGLGVISAVPEVIYQQLPSHVLANQWQEFEFEYLSKCYGCKCITMRPDEDYSTLLLFGEQLPVISPHQRDIAELCLTHISFLRQQQDIDLKLKELGRHMLYQIVWSESLEWIRTLEVEDDAFYKKLMVRLMLLTESSAGAIYIEADDARPVWHYKGLSYEDIEQIEGILKDKEKDLYVSMVMEEYNHLPDAHPDCPVVENHAHLFLCPVIDPNGRRKAIILLSKRLLQDCYSITDHVYINQLITQVYTGIEKNRLVAALESSNRSLEKEHRAQKVLIQKLQDTQDQLLQSEKMASIGQLAAGVAHEINNPIGFVNSNLSTLSEFSQSMLTAIQKIGKQIEAGNDSELKQFYTELAEEHEVDFITDDLPSLLAESKDGISRVKDIVQDLKDFSRTDSGEFATVDIHNIIDKTLNLIHSEVKYSADLTTEYGQLPEVEVMESQIGQVILNLLVNASHAIEDKGSIHIKTTLNEDQKSIQISVTDSGKGICPEHLGKLFDPFFTTKPVGKGTGLGLSLSYGIIQRHHGDIEVTSELGVGTTFRVTLPIVQPPILDGE